MSQFNSSLWGEFHSLSKLDFSIHGTPENHPAKVYANSRNMIEVIIEVELKDKAGKKVDFAVHDPFGLPIRWPTIRHDPFYIFYICHSETGEDLGSPWVVSDYPNEYINGASTAPPSDSSGITYIHKYISCGKHDFGEMTEKISVGVNIPGYGKFDTSSSGTSTKMPSGSTFKSPKSYEVTAILPIDYGNRSNIQIECGGFETINNGLKWSNVRNMSTNPADVIPWGLGLYPLREEHWNGEVRRRIVYIRPNPQTTGQSKFKKHAVLYDPLWSESVSTETIHLPDERTPGFSVINDKTDRPSAVTSYGGNRDDYQVNLWYSRLNHLIMDGQFILADGHWWYVFNEDRKAIEEDHRGDDEDGAATLLLYKLVMPTSANGKWNCGWKDVAHPMTVNVTDVYGNDGSFQVTFSGETIDKFDEPQLV